MTAKIFPQGKKEKQKDKLRKYSVKFQIDAIILLLAVITFLEMILGLIDISAGYMQNWLIRQYIYVLPPH